jgi:type VI protein secretion system component VasK
MRMTERLAPVAAAMSALATLACCLPLGIAGAVGALGLSVALESLQPWLIGIALILLGVSAFQIYRGGKTCKRPSRLSLVLFGLSAAIVLAVIIFPQKLAELMAVLQ